MWDHTDSFQLPWDKKQERFPHDCLRPSPPEKGDTTVRRQRTGGKGRLENLLRHSRIQDYVFNSWRYIMKLLHWSCIMNLRCFLFIPDTYSYNELRKNFELSLWYFMKYCREIWVSGLLETAEVEILFRTLWACPWLSFISTHHEIFKISEFSSWTLLI